MTLPVTLAAHISFHELPFCGVLLDSRSNRVYRLPPETAAALRRVLRGPLAVGPYESLIVAEPTETTAGADTAAMLRSLAALGLVRIDGGARHKGDPDAR
jgi:hypothetical protein